MIEAGTGIPARILAVLIALTSSSAFGQTPAALLTTPVGHELTVHIGGYDYVEPGDLKISIHGVKVGGGYTGAWALNPRHCSSARASRRTTRTSS